MVDFQYTIKVHAIFLYTMTTYGEDHEMAIIDEDGVDSNEGAHQAAALAPAPARRGYDVNAFREQQVKALSCMIDDKDCRIAELEAELSASRAKASELECANQGLRAELNAVREEFSVFQIDYHRCERLGFCPLQMRDDYLKRAEDAEEKVDALEKKLASKDDLSDIAHSNSQKMEELKDRLAEYEEVSRLYLHSGGPGAFLCLDDSSNSMNGTWKGRCRELTLRIWRLLDVISDKDVRIEELGGLLDGNDAMIDELEGLLDGRYARIDELEGLLDSMDRKVDRILRSRVAKKGQIAALRAKVARAYASKRHALSLLTESAAEDQKQLKTLKTRLKNQEQMLKDAQQTIDCLTAP